MNTSKISVQELFDKLEELIGEYEKVYECLIDGAEYSFRVAEIRDYYAKDLDAMSELRKMLDGLETKADIKPVLVAFLKKQLLNHNYNKYLMRVK